MSYACPICYQRWKLGQKSIQCVSCLNWIHHDNKNNCSGLTDSEFLSHCNDINKQWECDKCVSNSFMFLPFTHGDDSISFEVNSNLNHLSNDVNFHISNDDKIFRASCDSMINLFDNDDEKVDDEINLPTTVNSKYYDIKQLNALKNDPISSFGLFHVNIASLDKHIDDLKLILRPNSILLVFLNIKF